MDIIHQEPEHPEGFILTCLGLAAVAVIAYKAVTSSGGGGAT